MDISSTSDIAVLSMALSQSSATENVSIALTKKVMEDGSQNSQTIVNMMDALDESLGSNIDVRA